jgi:hypothetical protein
MTIPSAETQIRFLQDIQALLDDGQFTATYKFALLIALTDLSVESDIDDDGTLSISLESIARKFIEYYWQQSTPFVGRNAAEVLRQNAGRQAALVSELVQVRSEGIGSLAQLKSRAAIYHRSARKVARIVKQMPLFRAPVHWRCSAAVSLSSRSAGRSHTAQSGRGLLPSPVSHPGHRPSQGSMGLAGATAA